jgi:hypothetical protein
MWPDGHPVELGGDGLRPADVPVLVVDGADHLTAVTDPRFKTVSLAFLADLRSTP